MRPMQFRISVQVSSVLVLLGVVAVVAYGRFKEYREIIQFASGLVGGIAAVYALLLSVQNRRSTAASRFIARYNDPSFAELRKNLSRVVSSLEPNHTSDPYSNNTLFNFFEEMALAVNSNEADEGIVRGFFFSISGRFYRALEPQIIELRKTANQPTAFVEYERLYRRWNKS